MIGRTSPMYPRLRGCPLIRSSSEGAIGKVRGLNNGTRKDMVEPIRLTYTRRQGVGYGTRLYHGRQLLDTVRATMSPSGLKHKPRARASGPVSSHVHLIIDAHHPPRSPTYFASSMLRLPCIHVVVLDP